MRKLASIAAVALTALALGACGEDSGGSGPVKLNWWAYNEPSGSFRKAAENCTKQSNGEYEIVFNALGNDADTQRQQLVRRLAAEDSSIDLMSMDVIWTAEFAEAGWIKPWPEDLAAEVRKGTLKGPLETAVYDGKLYAAPANSNTQLLWYRKDLVKQPPETWDELIDEAAKMKEAGQIEIQGAAYEGTTVWFNALVTSAGGQILDGPTTLSDSFEDAAGEATRIMHKLATSPAANPSLRNQREDQNRLAFEGGAAAFQINYPFVYPSAKDNAPKIFKQMGWAPYPAVKKGEPAKAPIGGFNWGVGGYTKHPEEAFDAATCLRSAESQRLFANDGGLPPTLESLYDDPKFVKSYPFAPEIRKQLENAGVRPRSPVYSDVSLAIYTTVSPPGDFDPKSVVGELKDKIEKALESKGLL